MIERVFVCVYIYTQDDFGWDVCSCVCIYINRLILTHWKTTLNVCMCVCVRAYIYINVCMCVCVRAYMNIDTSLYVYYPCHEYESDTYVYLRRIHIAYIGIGYLRFVYT